MIGLIVSCVCGLGVLFYVATHPHYGQLPTSWKTISYSCLDEDGKPVDSWTALKAEGSYNYYMYNSESSAYWDKSPYSLDQQTTSHGAIMRTMQQIYKSADNSLMTAIYNDEPPAGKDASETYAHAKGILVASANGEAGNGFWLVHSMPKWPQELSADSAGPLPSNDFAQSFTCVTVTADTADSIAANLMLDRVYIYDSRIPGTSDVARYLPNFFTLISDDHGRAKRTSTTTSVLSFMSLAGKEYYQFAKSGKWGKDLWDDLIAPYFHMSMNVETWRDGVGGRMGSRCPAEDGLDVNMISTITMPDGTSWDGTRDHSKVSPIFSLIFFSLTFTNASIRDHVLIIIVLYTVGYFIIY